MGKRRATGKDADGILRNMLIPPTPRMLGRLAARATLAMLTVSSAGCSSRFFTVRPDSRVETIHAEPAPAPSDSAGVARLHTLLQVGHRVSLYHPAVIERGAPWDSAFIRAATVVRSATDPQQLTVAYRRLLSVLQDPITRVELADEMSATGGTDTFAFGSERTRDSVLIVRVPLGSAQRALFTESAAAMVRQLLETAPARVILDVRGSGATTSAATGAVLDSLDADVDLFVASAGLVTQLNGVPTTMSTERTRQVGGARVMNGLWQPDDAWMVRTGRPVFAGSATPRRVMVLANRATVLPRALLSLVASGRATLLAEEGVDDTPLVSSVVLPIADRVSVRLRTGELVHADGSTG